MSAHKLINILAVNKVADLAPSIDPVHGLTGQSVPEPYAPIGSATTGAHHSVLMGVPRDSLDSSDMFIELHNRFRKVRLAPNYQLIVVTPRGQLLLIRAPLEATDLLLVALEFGEVIILHPDVSVEDCLISRTT